MIARFFRLICLFSLLTLLVVAALAGWVQREMETPLELPEDRAWIIERGASLGQVSRALHEQGFTAHPRLFSIYARLHGLEKIQAGSYRLEPDDTARRLLEKFNRGDVVQHQVTFPEGWTFRQWLQHLKSKDHFTALDESRLLAEVGMTESNPEGWFFPDTYSFTDSDSAADILRRAHLRMRAELEAAWQQRDDGLPYDDPYQVLIMASIVERETGVPQERAEIAGVFVRRLQKGMRLQTDPTVIYGLGADFDGNLQRKHLRQATAYNTYVIKGLPPTPIAMPGRAALQAAVHPAPGSSLFFVARGDGSHQFSDTLRQHEQAVQQYQIKKRASDYRSAPKKPE